jgi:predicted MFS family arabinose efflux permease
VEISTPTSARPRFSPYLLPFLGITSGVSVAAIYYNQPLLHLISQNFHATSGQTGLIAVATQIGYAFGILFFVPLSDSAERRRLIVRLFAANTISLALAAAAPSLSALIAISVLIGLTAAVTHVLVPIAPELADEHGTGRAIGIMMTGLLLGVLLSRTLSGVLAALFGWRMVFLLAAIGNAVFTVLLRCKLPKLPPPTPSSYRETMRSLITILRTQPQLREASLLGFLVFAGFIAFWTNIAFLMGSDHYRLGPGAAGSFGLLGASGTLIASFAGRWTDRKGPRFVLGAALALLISGFGILWAGGYRLAGLILGVIVIDVGQQMMQISNQTRIFRLLPGARGRINTIYMTVFFAGAAIGSAGSTWAWTRWQWPGVCGFALFFLCAAALVHITGQKEQPAAEEE